MKIDINEIQHFCTHDGPGLRTVVFMNGCPLSCKWCHNPESRLSGNRIFFTESNCIHCKACAFLPCKAHIFSENKHYFDRSKCINCGDCVAVCPSFALENTLKETDTDKVLKEVLKDKPFYGKTGGITLSGGEPLYQAESVVNLLQKCKRNGIHTAIETCGFFERKYLSEIAQITDLLLWDLKDTDENRHINNTGVSLKPILDNLFAADKLGIKLRLRCIMLNGINTDNKHLAKIREIAENLKNLQGIDLIPYHPYGENKYKRLGIDDVFDDKKYIPSKKQTELFKNTLLNI